MKGYNDLNATLHNASSALTAGVNRVAFSSGEMQKEFPERLQAFKDAMLPFLMRAALLKSDAAIKKIANFLFEVGSQISDSEKNNYFLRVFFQRLDEVPGLLGQLRSLANAADPLKPTPPQPAHKVDVLLSPLAALQRRAISRSGFQKPAPTPQSIAREVAKGLVPEEVDPDQVTVQFREFQTDWRNTLAEWEGSAAVANAAPTNDVYHAMTLTQAVLENFRSDKAGVFYQPDTEVSYRNAANKTIKLNSNGMADQIATADVQSRFDSATNRYFDENRQALIRSQNGLLNYYVEAQVARNTLSEESAAFIKQTNSSTRSRIHG